MLLFSVSRHLSNLSRLSKPGDNSRFWIGQIMVILSTIVGVYLAASAGFEQAIKFDAMVNKRNAYHMLSSLEAELNDNISITNSLSKSLKRPSVNKEYILRRHKMGKFVWQAMLESDETFELPAPILTGVRRYYTSIETLRYELKNNHIGSDYFVEKVKKEHAILNKKVIPEIEKEKEYLTRILTSLNVSYDKREMD